MLEKVVLIAQAHSEDVLAIECALHKANIQNRVQWVTSGSEIVDYLQVRGKFSGKSLPPPALILLDVDLPQSFQALEWITARQKDEFSGVALIVTAGMMHVHLIKEAYSRGAHSFLITPVRVEDIVRMVRGIKGISLGQRVHTASSVCQILRITG